MSELGSRHWRGSYDMNEEDASTKGKTRPEQGELIGPYEALTKDTVHLCQKAIQELHKKLRYHDQDHSGDRYLAARLHLGRASFHLEWALKAYLFENVPEPSGVVRYPDDNR